MMSRTTGALNVVAGAAAGSGSVDDHFEGFLGVAKLFGRVIRLFGV